MLKQVDERVRGRFDEVVIYSFDSQDGKGLLDFLPASATKQTALEYVAGEFGAAKEEVVFCGDSGNDIFPLTAGFRGVLVRNADNQLVENVQKALNENPDLKAYFAKGGFRGLNGYYTSGVIEGACYYGILRGSRLVNGRYYGHGTHGKTRKETMPVLITILCPSVDSVAIGKY